MRRNAGFTAVALLTLALAIGANTAIFSFVHGILIKPLPYADPERLVRVFEESPTFSMFPVAPGNFLDYRAESSLIESMALYMWSDAHLVEGERPEHVSGMQVSAGFFGVLGVTPALGRDFTREDEVDGSHRVVVLSHRLWVRRFDRDPEIIGRGIRLSGEPCVVVGVLPAGLQHVGGTYRSYAHGESVDLWRPFVLRPESMPRNQHYTNVVARLADNTTLDQASEELAALAARLATDYPNTNANWTTRLVPLREEIVGASRPMLLVLLATVAMVLLIACVNVASLLIARGTDRAREMAIRFALGAGRLRLFRQVMLESLPLALIGGTLGALIAFWGVDALVAMSPEDLARRHMVRIELGVLGFNAGITLLTALLFGLAPAFGLARRSPLGALREGQSTGYVRVGSQKLRTVLVISEVALAFVLLAGAGLLVRSFVSLTREDPGFRDDGVLTLRFWLPPSRYDPRGVLPIHDRILEAISALPGVHSVGTSSDLPWTGYDENSGFAIPGRTFPPGEGPQARYHRNSPDYFRTIGVPLVAGRFLTDADTFQAPPVVLINESLARRYWLDVEGAGDPVGTHARIWGEDRTIVGIVGDVKDEPTAAQAKPAFYFPMGQMPQRDMIMAVRVAGEPMNMAEAIRTTVLRLDPELPLADIKPLSAIAGSAVTTERFTMLVICSFGGTALFLAAVGLYGVISQMVGQRTQEIGIRMALGATSRQVRGLVLRRGLAITMIGLILGIGASVALTGVITSLLYWVSATGPLTFTLMALILLAVALLACYLPARRATNISPMNALRHE